MKLHCLPESTLRDYATEAIRYWEPRRLFYNLLLVVVVVITFWLNLPFSRAITVDSVLWLFLLAVVANVAYCAAYIVDLSVQASDFRSHWQQFRWLLFALGSGFAAVLTRYVSMTLFAAVAAGSQISGRPVLRCVARTSVSFQK
jgi:hypothetical protein